MGAQFSLGTAPEELEKFTRFSRVESCYRKFLKRNHKLNPNDGGHFIRQIFPLDSGVAHACFTKYFQRGDDESESRMATVAEVWGALILAAIAESTTKIRFLFQLHDRNKDHRLNRVELIIALESSTQGLARLKRNPFPPPASLITKLADDIINSPSTNLNKHGEVDCTSVIAFLNSDQKCMKYFQNLELGSFDSAAMIRRQEKLLIELAEVDAKLLEHDSEARYDKLTQERYLKERGGDVATGLLRVMHEEDNEKELASDLHRLYSNHQAQKLIHLPADNDMTIFGGVVESRPGTSVSTKNKSARSSPQNKKVMSAANGETSTASPKSSAVALTEPSLVSASSSASGSLKSAAEQQQEEYEHAAQLERREARSAAKLAAIKSQTTAPDAAVFGRGRQHSLEAIYSAHLAKADQARAARDLARAQGKDMSSLADDEEEKVAMGLMERVWVSICDPRTELSRLDLDTFEDIWEAGTGELLCDKEALKLIDSLSAEANQLGEHAFSSMRLAYKNRRQWLRDANAPVLPPWQSLLQELRDAVIQKPHQFHEASIQTAKKAGKANMYQSIFIAKQKQSDREDEERAQMEWEEAEEARLLAERLKRKAARKAEKKRANMIERAELLGITMEEMELKMMSKSKSSPQSTMASTENTQFGNTDNFNQTSPLSMISTASPSFQGEVVMDITAPLMELTPQSEEDIVTAQVSLGPPIGGSSIGIDVYSEYAGYKDSVYWYSLDEEVETNETWVPKSLREDYDRMGIEWPPPEPEKPKRSFRTGKSQDDGGYDDEEDDEEEEDGDDEDNQEDQESEGAYERNRGLEPRSAALSLSCSVGHMMDAVASLNIEVLGSAGSAPGLSKGDHAQSSTGTQDAVSGIAAAMAKAEQAKGPEPPSEEPLYTTAARLISILEDEQAIANTPTDLFKSAISTTTSGTGESSTDEGGSKKKEEEQTSEWYTPESVWWLDLDTIHGGDPDALPVLRKLAQTLQATIDAIPADDKYPTIGKTVVRVVKCRLTKSDFRRERRRLELLELKETTKKAHQVAEAVALSEGRTYEKPKKKKKKKNGEKGPPKEEIDYQYFIRVVFFSSINPLSYFEHEFSKTQEAEREKWEGQPEEAVAADNTDDTEQAPVSWAESLVKSISEGSFAESVTEQDPKKKGQPRPSEGKIDLTATTEAAEEEEEEDDDDDNLSTPRSEENDVRPIPTFAKSIESAQFTVEFSQTLDSLMTDTKRYEGLEGKLFGIQYDELPVELAQSPAAFAVWTRSRRDAALSVASGLRDQSLTMSTPQVTALLQEHGMSVQGTYGEQRMRLATCLEAHADRIGYGELSQLGTDVARSIYRRFTTSAERFYALGPEATELTYKVHELEQPAGYVREIAKQKEEEERLEKERIEKEEKEKNKLAKKSKGKLKKQELYDKLSKKSKSKEKIEEKKPGKEGEEEEEEVPDLGLTLLEHMEMQRALKRPLAMCVTNDEYKTAMQASEVLVDGTSRPLEDGFVAYYALSQHGELAEDARQLGIGSMDDLLAGLVTIIVKADGGELVSLCRRFLSPHERLSLLTKKIISMFADTQEFYADGEVSKFSDLLSSMGYGWADRAAKPSLPDLGKEQDDKTDQPLPHAESEKKAAETHKLLLPEEDVVEKEFPVLIQAVFSFVDALRETIKTPALIGDLKNRFIERMRVGEGALLTQMRKAVSSYFGDHFRSSVPDEWESKNDMFLMTMKKQESILEGTPSNEVKDHEKRKQQPGQQQVQAQATDSTHDLDASLDGSSIAEEDSVVVDPTMGVYGLEWLHNGKLESLVTEEGMEGEHLLGGEQASTGTGTPNKVQNMESAFSAMSSLTHSKAPVSDAQSRPQSQSKSRPQSPSTLGGEAAGTRRGSVNSEAVEVEEFCDLTVGSVKRLEELKLKTAQLKALLQGKLARVERLDYEQEVRTASTEMALLERSLKHNRWLALAMALRSYDGISRVVKGVSCVGFGGRDITFRVCTDGFDFVPHFFPAIDEALPDFPSQDELGGGNESNDEGTSNELRSKKMSVSTGGGTLVLSQETDEEDGSLTIEDYKDNLRPLTATRNEVKRILLREARERQKKTVEIILETRKKRWEATASGVAAKVEIMRREANKAKAREGLRYEEGLRELQIARTMKDPNYVRLAKDPKVEEVVEKVLTAWRDLREAVALRNKAACDDWNNYEAAMNAPRSKKVARPAMPLIVRPLSTTQFPEKDFYFLEVAVCESNLAVILHEFADGRVDWKNESSFLIERSVETIDKVVERYEKQARHIANKMISSGRATLPKLVDSNTQEKGGEVEVNEGEGGEGSAVIPAQDSDSKNEFSHEGSEDDETEESSTAKQVRESREALYLEQCLWDAVPEICRVGRIILHHNKLRIMTDQVATNKEIAAISERRKELKSSQETDPPVSPLTIASFKETSQTMRETQMSETHGSGGSGGGGGGGGDDDMSVQSLDEDEVIEAKQLEQEQEKFLISCLETYENSAPPIRGQAGSQAPKLSKYIGIERLGVYPPPEFEDIYELRRKKIEQAKLEAKLKKQQAAEERRKVKEAKRVAKEAKKKLREDPFNIELLELAGDKDKAKMLRLRTARRDMVLQKFNDKKAKEEKAREDRVRKEAAFEEAAYQKAAEAAANRGKSRAGRSRGIF